jgi:U-box domain
VKHTHQPSRKTQGRRLPYLTMNHQQGGGGRREYGATGPQMKRARKHGVVVNASSSTTTTSIATLPPLPPLPPLQSASASATSSSALPLCDYEVDCGDDDDAISITSTTRMSEECCSLDGVVEECSNNTNIHDEYMTVNAATATAASADTSTVDVPSPHSPPLSPSFVPRGFRCPLSSQVMLDPVLDGEGNTYEYSAILDWLKVPGHCTSPISHQPLSERMLNPNNSLREAIHEYMGQEWVQNARQQRQQQQQQQEALLQEQTQSSIHHASISNMSTSDNSNNTSMDSSGERQQQQPENHHDQQQQLPIRSSSRQHHRREIVIAAVADPDQRSRQKIDCFLQFVLLQIHGLQSLSLDEYGCCAFQYNGIMIVIDVPLQTGTFCFYTRNLVPYEPTEAMKDLLLELNFLQGKSRKKQSEMLISIV